MEMSETLEETGFHDSELAFCSLKDGVARFCFQNIAVETESDDHFTVMIQLSGITEARRDGQPISRLSAEGEGSHVIQFERHGPNASLLIYWSWFSKKLDVFARYDFRFSDYKMDWRKQEGLIG